MRTLAVIPLLIVCISAQGSEEESLEAVRNPKIFLVSTTTTTTTVSTNYNCYQASNDLGPYVCIPGGRKRRSLLDEPTFLRAPSDLIEATPIQNDDYISDDIIDGKNEELDLEGSRRKAKVFNYFMTATKTTTFFTYTATSTIASILCTPEGWTMAPCPGSKGKKK